MLSVCRIVGNVLSSVHCTHAIFAGNALKSPITALMATTLLAGDAAAPAAASVPASGGGAQPPAPAAPGAAAAAAAGEHEELGGPHPKPEELAGRLLAAGPGGVDHALLAAAAKALRDVSVLDRQLLRSRLVRSRSKIATLKSHSGRQGPPRR